MGQLACHTIAALFYIQVYVLVRIAAKSHYSSARVCRDTPTPLDCNAGGTVYEGQDTYPSMEAPRLRSRDQSLSRRKRHLADIGESGALVYPLETPRFPKGEASPTTPLASPHPIPVSSG